MGAVPEDLWETLRRSPSLCKELTQQLLDEFWPSTLHTAIRQAIGLPQPTDDIIATIRRATRLPRFREEILRAYQRRCAVCGYDGRLADIPLGLEAAHIKWHAYQGPDQVDNGVALCSFHHIALDAGALGLSDDLHILISCDVNGQTMIEEFCIVSKVDASCFLNPAICRRPAIMLRGTVRKSSAPLPVRQPTHIDQSYQRPQKEKNGIRPECLSM